MKKTLVFLAGCVMVAISCQKSSLTEMNGDNGIAVNDGSQYTGRRCASYEVLQRQLNEDPALAERMASFERIVQRNLQNPSAYRLVNGVVNIPVVVNVIYNGASQNISLQQIQSQITVLNEDYNATNADISSVPTLFSSVKGNVGIKFVLDSVRRKSTTKKSWTTNDAVKKTSQGGLDPLSPTTKLNIWVCNLGNNLLGYAQFPGGALATDGVVILYSAFGSRAKYSAGTYITSYDLGRTATHEVGHWLNLRHIWGDATCGSDLVSDTPLHNAANFGCPVAGHKSTCTGTPIEMTMNYMDYTDDACMYMFSAGQKTRMLAVFAVGGPRNSFAQP